MSPDVPQTCAPLSFAETPATTGTDAVVMGYPGGGNFVATPARVREIIELSGPDIYRTTTVEREVYTIRGSVRQGNSGGPMIDKDGRVLGVVFGAAVDDADTGFVLTADEVSHQLAKLGNSERVPTGACSANCAAACSGSVRRQRRVRFVIAQSSSTRSQAAGSTPEPPQ